MVDELTLRMSAWDDKAAAEVRRQCFERIELCNANLLAAWGLDRISREGAVKVMGFIQLLESHYGCAFYSYQEPFLCTGTNPEQRELMLTLLAWVAKWESGRRSDRLKARAASKRAHATVLGERARWGRGRMANDADVERALELRANGRSIRTIAADLGLSIGATHALLHQRHERARDPGRSNPPP